MAAGLLGQGTLRRRIIALLDSDRDRRFTNFDIAANLGAPEASVRRMTLDLIGRGDIMTDGSSKLPYVYYAVPSPAPQSMSV